MDSILFDKEEGGTTGQRILRHVDRYRMTTPHVIERLFCQEASGGDRRQQLEQARAMLDELAADGLLSRLVKKGKKQANSSQNNGFEESVYLHPEHRINAVTDLARLWFCCLDSQRRYYVTHEEIKPLFAAEGIKPPYHNFFHAIAAEEGGDVLDGYRESEQSWSELLLDLKQRGLAIAPKIAMGDGALGFWAALRKVFPETREQRCWVHKTANVLNKLPKSVQPKAKGDLHEIWQAETKADAETVFKHFLEKYDAKYPQACESLRKDQDELLAFYDFPAEHWGHLRTTNPIESTFATIRLRHRKTKGNGTRRASLAMMFKLAQSAEKKWRRLRS